jgi:hypothetical protein
MASIQLKKMIPLLLTAILNTVVLAAGNALLTAEQRHMALCVETIARQYFNHGRSTVVSMPPDLLNNSRRPLVQFPYSDDVQLVDLVLQHVHKETWCPVQMQIPKIHMDITAEINHSYIIFIRREQEEENIINLLRTQPNKLKYDEILKWNPRERFVVDITEQDSSSVMSEAVNICEIMWMEHKAVNTVVLMPASSGDYIVLGSHTKMEIGMIYLSAASG